MSSTFVEETVMVHPNGDGRVEKGKGKMTDYGADIATPDCTADQPLAAELLSLHLLQRYLIQAMLILDPDHRLSTLI